MCVFKLPIEMLVHPSHSMEKKKKANTFQLEKHPCALGLLFLCLFPTEFATFTDSASWPLLQTKTLPSGKATGFHCQPWPGQTSWRGRGRVGK